MRKVELSLKELQKYEIIKKLIESNGNKNSAKIKLGLKSKNFSVVFVSEDIVELNILMFNPHKLKLAEISTYFTSMEGVVKSIEIH